MILDLYGDNFIFETYSWLGLWSMTDNSTSFWCLLTGTRLVVFHMLILSHHQANTWLNRLVLHGALKTSLLGFLLSWEGKWIFYASVENVLPLGSWNSSLGMVNRVHWLISSNIESHKECIIFKGIRIWVLQILFFLNLDTSIPFAGAPFAHVGEQMFYFIFLVFCDYNVYIGLCWLALKKTFSCKRNNTQKKYIP